MTRQSPFTYSLSMVKVNSPDLFNGWLYSFTSTWVASYKLMLKEAGLLLNPCKTDAMTAKNITITVNLFSILPFRCFFFQFKFSLKVHFLALEKILRFSIPKELL